MLTFFGQACRSPKTTSRRASGCWFRWAGLNCIDLPDGLTPSAPKPCTMTSCLSLEAREARPLCCCLQYWGRFRRQTIWCTCWCSEASCLWCFRRRRGSPRGRWTLQTEANNCWQRECPHCPQCLLLDIPSSRACRQKSLVERPSGEQATQNIRFRSQWRHSKCGRSRKRFEPEQR